MTNMEFLWNEWQRLWSELGCMEAGVRLVFDDLVCRYSEPHRHYHTLQHIEHCLQEFAVVREHCPHPAAVECALWLHDAVYDPRAKDNEQRSADLLLDIAQAYQMNVTDAIIAHKCVKDTTHAHDPGDLDRQLVVDIDCAILGQSWEVYDRYTTNVRKEYGHVPKLIYRFARRRFMRAHFLDAPRIFYTPIMHERYEARARENIMREVRELGLWH